MVKSQCLYNGEEFIPRRSNQKFASNKNRMNYHNSRYSSIRKMKAKFDEKLHKNFCILNKLISNDDFGLFHREFLKGKGYSMNVLTHFVKFEGKEMPALYDFVIEPQNDEIKFHRIQ